MFFINVVLEHYNILIRSSPFDPFSMTTSKAANMKFLRSFTLSFSQQIKIVYICRKKIENLKVKSIRNYQAPIARLQRD
jgi:hypothetical protein